MGMQEAERKHTFMSMDEIKKGVKGYFVGLKSEEQTDDDGNVRIVKRPVIEIINKKGIHLQRLLRSHFDLVDKLETVPIGCYVELEIVEQLKTKGEMYIYSVKFDPKNKLPEELPEM